MNSGNLTSKAHIVFFKPNYIWCQPHFGQIEHPESGIIEGSPFSWGTLRVWGGGAHGPEKCGERGSFQSPTMTFGKKGALTS